MSFMTTIHTRKFNRIPNKEDWQIVKDEILVTLFGKEPHGPSTHITDRITRTFLTSDGGDSLQNLCLLPNSCQEFGVG